MNSSKLRRLAAIPMIGLAALGLTACASPQRPSAEELKSVLQDVVDSSSGLDAAQLDAILTCLSAGIVASDLSDETLNKAVTNKEGTSEEQEQFEAVTAEVLEGCMDTTMSSATPTATP